MRQLELPGYEAAILTRLVGGQESSLAPAAAQGILNLTFGPVDKERRDDLAARARAGFKGPNLSGVDKKTGKIVSLFNPRRHKWGRHFRWDGARLVGRTPTGRATVATLRINFDHRVAHRQQMVDEGVFPPIP